jgi:phage baseplate assembly protein W
MRFLSVKFPFGDDTVGGKLFKTNTTSLEDLRSSLYFFITTRKGDRWYDPEFGTSLYKYLFEKNDELVANEVATTVREEIERYFKNILIQDITFDQSQTNALILTIDFVFNNISSSVEVAVTA